MKLPSALQSTTQLPAHDGDISLTRAHTSPGIIWIELTSRCPFDCVFCSRKLLRGTGQHMNFELFKKIISELKQPEIIRLNYSGESSHYPFVVEACELASATRARVELVTVLASLPWHHVDRLARAGISRLTISLHTLDETRFREIYRFSSIHEMQARIDRIMELTHSSANDMEVDFAFVAMRRNLADLHAIAEYAARLGILRIDVHPVIRRDPIPETFEAELDGDRLRPEFLGELSATLEVARRRHPSMTFNVSTPELMDQAGLDEEAHPYPWPLSGEANIHGCEQDPWNTIHILAGGEVVSCEVRDQIVMGNLIRQSLSSIWNGPAYTSFRTSYFHGRDAKCRNCTYKIASLPGLFPSSVHAPDYGRSALIYGWHPHDQESVFWSQGFARIALFSRGAALLRIRGLLPPGRDSTNVLTLVANGLFLKRWTHDGENITDVHLELRIRVHGRVLLEFETAVTYNARERGTGDDPRDLGFALIEATLIPIG